MKRNFKRLFALVMTLALAISCATGAFAAESVDTSEDMQYVVVRVVDGIATVETTDELPASVLATSRTFVDINDSLSNGNSRSGSFVYPANGGSLILVYGARGSGSLTVKLTSSREGNLYEGSTNGGTVKQAAWYNRSQGETITWNISASGGNIDLYALNISGVF